MQNDGIVFFTATCLNWQPLLFHDSRKQIVLDSLKFLVTENRIWLYAFVIMPNHIHLLWRKKENWIEKDVQLMFLRYTAQQIKFQMIDSNQSSELALYKSTQGDRNFHFWKRKPYKAEMYNRKVATQKVDYIHYNPVKAGLCEMPEDYWFSSARFYELNQDDFGFLTHYMEHL